MHQDCVPASLHVNFNQIHVVYLNGSVQAYDLNGVRSNRRNELQKRFKVVEQRRVRFAKRTGNRPVGFVEYRLSAISDKHRKESMGRTKLVVKFLALLAMRLKTEFARASPVN